MHDVDSDEGGDAEVSEDMDQKTSEDDHELANSGTEKRSQNTTDTSPSSEEEPEFQASESNGDELEATEEDHCIFCKQAEEDDPSEDFEPYLACASCNSHSHRQCARENAAVNGDDNFADWKCPDCSTTHTKSQSPKQVTMRHRNSAPRLVRDLLPVSRGVQRPNSHSIFAQPLISEGEDGGRALRKRKSSELSPKQEKRRRKNASWPPSSTANGPFDRNKVEEANGTSHSNRRGGPHSKPLARILQHRPFNKPPPHKFILAFRVEQDQIDKILSIPPKPGRRKERKRVPKIPPPPIYQPPIPKFPALPNNHLIFPSLLTERENELSSKPYGGVLSEAEADTSRSLPQLRDREIFEVARKEAEEERRRTSAAADAEMDGENASLTKPSRTVSGPPSKIKCIQFGKFVIDTFYAAPYPEEYSHESRLFICEFCLKYLPSEFVAYRHKLKCPAKHPPGDEIYRDGSISIWEVDGRKKTEYCQCLCLMAKMFLGSKTLYYDVEPFLFYILTEYDEFGYHFVGYFSKEKRPASQNNVSCILVMPIHQRKGYATYLIDFSYLLTRIEGKDGSPEKPLSDMGLTAYRSYWDLTISRHLLDMELKPFSTKALMMKTGMTADDVIHSLERLYAFTRDPVTKAYAIRYDKTLYETIVNQLESKKHRKLKPENLIWTPYIMGRSDQATLDGQPIQTIAPRDDEIELDETVRNLDTNSTDGELPNLENADAAVDFDAVSPRSKGRSNQQKAGDQMGKNIHKRSVSLKKEDFLLTNEQGVVAPGPPSTNSLHVAVASEISRGEMRVNGLTNGEGAAEAEGEAHFTGYALTYHNNAIPPTRFQIEPPIPPSMLRSRSIKKRIHTSSLNHQKVNGSAGSSAIPTVIRSSPRNASSVNGMSSSGASTPEKAETPVRRSRRHGIRSSLVNMEVVSSSLDGTKDEASDSNDEVDEEVKGSSEDVEDIDDENGSASSESGEDDNNSNQDIAVVDEDDSSDDEEGEEENDEEADAEQVESLSTDEEEDDIESQGVESSDEEDDAADDKEDDDDDDEDDD